MGAYRQKETLDEPGEEPFDQTFDLEGGNNASVEKARCGVRTEHFFELRRGAYP